MKSRSLYSITIVMACAVLASSLFPGAVSAQTEKPGRIEGKVIDSQTGEGLPLVTVLLAGTKMGAASDLDGYYVILNVPAGRYEMTFSMIGYAKITVTDVEVKPGEATAVNAPLTTSAIQMKEIVVTAERVESTVAGLLATQKTAPTISDGLAAEQISKTPDSDAAGALKRVTGLSVVGGKYVYVRGLGERYSNTLLNGAPLASPEPNKRAVPLDIIPANLLEKVVVSKTFTPDQPGDFSGGSVQINAKEFPDNLIFEFSASGGLNSQSTFKDFQTYSGGKWDWLGIDDGTRAIPDAIPTDNVVRDGGRWWQPGDPGMPRDSLGVIGKTFDNRWASRTITAPLNQSYSLSIGNQFNRGSLPIGYLASLSYGNKYEYREEEINIYSMSTDKDGNTSLSQRNRFYNIHPSVYEVLWGGILNLSTKLSANNKVSLKTVYNRSAEDRVRTYNAYVRDYSTSPQDSVESLQLRYIQRSLLSSQLTGEHHLPGLLNSDFIWRATLSRATNDEPDRREILYFKEEGDSIWVWMDEPSSGSLFYSEMADREGSGSADWVFPFKQWNSMPSRLKFGASYSSTDREYDLRRFQLGIYVPSTRFDRSLLELPPEEIYAPEHIGLIDSTKNTWGFLPDEKTRNVDNYKAEQTIFSTYAMVDMPLSQHLRVITGLRIEDWVQDVTSYDIFDPDGTPISSDLDYTDYLPSLNLTYTLAEDMNIRAAFSQTLTRPYLRELALVEYTDFIDGIAEVGNPQLKRTLIQNYDLRWEYYRRPGELLAFSLSYKHFEDPIEKLYIASNNRARVPANIQGARNIAAELEMRSNLDVLGSLFANFNLTGNLALINSRVDIGDSVTVPLFVPGEDEPVEISTVQTSSERALEGQSPYVANLMLGYRHPGIHTELNLLYNVFGRRIDTVGSEGLPDIYEEARHEVDLTMSQPIAGRWQARFKATNLLNAEHEFTQGGLPQYTYTTGRSFSLGISYKL